MTKYTSTEVTFDITSSFGKNSMATLPLQNKWRIAKEDEAISGMVLTVIKRKGLLFNHPTGSTKARAVTITRQGFLIIYYREGQGYVVSLPNALKVKSSTKKSVQVGVKRICIEIKMSYGVVTLAIMGEEADQWIHAVLRSVCCSYETVKSDRELEMGPVVEKIASSVPETTTKEMEESTMKRPSLTADEFKQLSTPLLRSISTTRSCRSSESMTTTTIEPVSVRQGELSVAIIRQILLTKVANKMDLRKTSTQQDLKMTSSQLVQKKEAEEVVASKKLVLRRASYKSHSAPAVF